MRDINLEDFTLQMRNKAGIELVESIVDASIQRTIEGASTLTVTVDDDLYRPIQKSGKLGRRVDVNIDGLWFTLVAVNKQGRRLTLTFEDRSVNALRYYDKWLFASRGKMTRAQFVLLMIIEARASGIPIHYVIPELNAAQPVSDVLPGETILGAAGVPITKTSAEARPAGIAVPTGVPLAPGHQLTVKGVTATSEQIGIGNTVTATGVSMGARRKVLVVAIMTAIQESTMKNDTGGQPGQLDSVGVFQQRASMGWPASRNVAVDARAFFTAAIALDKAQPNLSYTELAQGVQHSGFPDAYARWQPEGEKFVIEYGIRGAGPGGTGDVAIDNSYEANNQKTTANKIGLPSAGYTASGTLPTSAGNTAGAGDYQFYRGNITQDPSGNGNWILKKENSWDCMGRLAQEVNWRRFCVSGFIYFISDPYLFRSAAFMTISEDSDGIDWIDYDYDEGKRVATITVTCHIHRWSAPPGSTVQIVDMGIPNGKWLVNDISRSLYNDIGTIVLKKPQPVLPEPTAASQAQQVPFGQAPGPPRPNAPGDPTAPGTKPDVTAPNACAQSAVDYAKSQLGVPYSWGAEEKGVAFDCSGLTQAAYSACAPYLTHLAQAQYDAGPRVFGPLQPGDLVFFDDGGPPPDPSNVGHCGIYIGNGQFIAAPHTGDVVKISDLTSGYYKDHYVGATRPSAKK